MLRAKTKLPGEVPLRKTAKTKEEDCTMGGEGTSKEGGGIGF